MMIWINMCLSMCYPMADYVEVKDCSSDVVIRRERFMTQARKLQAWLAYMAQSRVNHLCF